MFLKPRRLPDAPESWSGSSNLRSPKIPRQRSAIPLHNASFDFLSEQLSAIPGETRTAIPGKSRLVSSGKMASSVVSIFEQEYRALRPRAPMPQFHIRFRRFVSLNTTIRLRDGELHVSLSDLLEGAPEPVLHAIAHILIAKIYKKPIDRAHNHRYKRFQYSEAVARQTEQIRG